MINLSDDRYPLRTVSRWTGLSPDLIRAWERRYQVVEPVRGPRGARLYSRTDIDHLRLLGQLVGDGRAIGDIARLDIDILKGLAHPPASRNIPEPAEIGPSAVVGALLNSVERFDLRDLEVRLGDALLALGPTRFVQDVARPLLVEVGERWAAGRMSIADERLVSAALRRILGGLIRLRTVNSSASLLLATPPGEQHALGLTLLALLAVERGIETYLLGPDLPAAEITQAAARAGVAAVGLSVVNSDNRQNAVEQTRQVEQLLRPDIELWLGGRDARHLAEQLGPTRALILDRPDDVEVHLNRLRDHPGPALP